MKNSDIQLYFNRPDRKVNSGRITDIGNGSYSNSKAIPAASNAELDAFLADPTFLSSGRHIQRSDPLAQTSVAKHFAKGPDGLWRLSEGESDRCECKANFGFKHMDKWLRPIAALANNAGGFVFFGVHDKDAKGPNGENLSHAVCGLSSSEFANADPAEFSTRVKAMFDPTPLFRISTAEIGGKMIGIIQVQPHASRPVIAVKQDASIKEGDIFYRYPGQSSRIKYSDLRAILDARDADARAQILPMVEKLLQLGPARAMVADLDGGMLTDGGRALQIDSALLEKLSFIKAGEFSEVGGAPTLRLVGDVTAVEANGRAVTQLGMLTRNHVLEAFLNQNEPSDPTDYIRFALEVGQNERLPLHYFARLASMSHDDLVAFINSTSASLARKKKYVDWIKPDAAFHKAVGTPKSYLTKILAREMPVVTNATVAGHIGQAVQAMPSAASFDLSLLLKLLRECLAVGEGTSAVSFLRRGICRIDELLFG
ncbi:ATP-binding protein [Sphingomonas sp. ASV193]|uniref:AlbA family DNA-binding domain-containing protein n=1 Tax=Sphingomonas sp. ASV193 TaxID=3144405 RepID=UPI0032E88DEA